MATKDLTNTLAQTEADQKAAQAKDEKAEATKKDTKATEENTKEKEKAIRAATEETEAIIHTKLSMDLLTNSVSDASDALKRWYSNVKNSGTTDLTKELSLVATGIFGAKEAFQSLDSFKPTGIVTFGQQFKGVIAQMKDIRENAPAGVAIDFLSNSFKKLGMVIPEDKLTKAVEIGRSFGLSPVEALKRFAGAVINSADNAVKLEAGIINLAAKTGDLGNVYKEAGANLSDMNTLIQAHSNLMASAVSVTHLSAEEVSKYYENLGAIPGALKELNVETGTSIGKTNLLTASIMLATGTGRKHEEVTETMRAGFRSLNLTGEESAKLFARMSKLSQDNQIEFEDVKKAIIDTESAFKTFGLGIEARNTLIKESSNLLDTYVGALKKTGVSASTATEMMGDLINKVKGLDTAQKAFISAQTGGPGQLMGAFQIEKDLKEGKIGKVFEKVRKTMEKQFGKIVTIEEAAMSPQAAAQLTKQRMMLQQGQFGLARGPEEASRILEMFKSTAGKPIESKTLDSSFKEMMNMGNVRQKQTMTPISKMLSLLESTQLTVQVGNLDLFQQTMTAGSGRVRTDENAMALQPLVSGIEQQRSKSAKFGTEIQMTDIASKPDETGKSMVNSLKGFDDLIKQSSKDVKSVLKGFETAFNKKDKSGMEKPVKEYMDELKQREAEANKNTSKAERESQLKQINLDRENLKKGVDAIFAEKNKKKLAPTELKDLNAEKLGISQMITAEEPITAPPATPTMPARRTRLPIAPRAPGTGAATAQPVATASRRVVDSAAQERAQAAAGRGVNQPTVETQKHEVLVTGWCLKCKQEIESVGETSKLVNPTGTPSGSE